jgi:hypothetical protein
MGAGRIGGATAAAVLAVAACCATAARAGDGDGRNKARPSVTDTSAEFASEVAKVVEPYVPKLEALGQWCETSTLFIERAQVAEALVAIDADHAKARAWLRYKRQKDRSWKQTSTRPFFDEKTELLPEWKKRREDVAGPLRDELEGFLSRRQDWHTAGIRDRVLRTLLALWPEDAELRERNAEKQFNGRWLLKESEGLDGRRRRIRELAAAADKEARATVSQFAPFASERPVSFRTAEFTVKSDLPMRDAQEVAVRLIAARSLYEGALGVKTTFPKGFVVYVLPSIAEGKRLLASRSDVPEAHRRAVDGLSSYWVDDDELVLAEEQAAERLDAGVRHVLAMLRSRDVGCLFSMPGWMSEGVGMYLTHALLGTRLTVFVKETKYADDDVHRELANAGYDWVQAVRRLVLEKDLAPGLRTLTGTPLNSMTKDDALMAYALAAFFLAGRPDDLRALMSRMAYGHEFHESLAETCNVDVDALELRFVRWLREMK